MANLIIEFTNYESNNGTNYRALNANLDGKKIHSTLVGEAIVPFTEEAIQKVIRGAILDDFTPVQLTVNAPLSEGAKTAIADRYSGDPLITGIIFE